MERLRRFKYDLFTCLDHIGVVFDNNHAERSIRQAVIFERTVMEVVSEKQSVGISAGIFGFKTKNTTQFVGPVDNYFK